MISFQNVGSVDAIDDLGRQTFSLKKSEWWEVGTSPKTKGGRVFEAYFEVHWNSRNADVN